MDFEVYKWTIKEFLSKLQNGQINLKPPYQRNYIWGTSDQRHLIDSIAKRYPLPAFFLHEKGENLYDIIDGQQRTQTLIKFYKGEIGKKSWGVSLEASSSAFLDYNLVIVVISNGDDEFWVRDFFIRVNKLGKHLNRSELINAEFLGTRLLKLVEKMADLQEFKELDLFKEPTIQRMNDRDFVAELLALIEFGITDKKESVNELFEDDITSEQASRFENVFKETIAKLARCNQIFHLNLTRFRQKNDFYTLFGLLLSHPEIDAEDLDNLYKILVLLAKEIAPSLKGCPPLREYALNCVSQSNSKVAREIRLEILEKLLLNQNPEPNLRQADIIKYYADSYQLDLTDLNKVGPYYTFNTELLNQIYLLGFGHV